MSSCLKKRIDFSELDDHFDEDQHLDSLRYNADIDSAIQIKRGAESEKLNEVQQLLQFSPHAESEKQKLSSVRCSFGVNSTHMNPSKLQFYQNQNSVNSSVQMGSPNTAQFPLQKKFQKLYNMRQSIEELSAENDISQSREENSKKTKQSQNTEEIKKYEDIHEAETYQESDQFQYEQAIRELITQLEMTEEQLKIQQIQYQELQNKYEKSQVQIVYLTKLNSEITKTLDEQQTQLEQLNETNGLLKKKIQSLKIYSTTEQSQYNGNTNTNRYNNKENIINDYLKQHSNTETNQSSELIHTLKKSQKLSNTYSNVMTMILLMIQKCFYLDENIDKEGKEIINKINSQLSSKTLDNLVIQIECLIKVFEQRFSDMVKTTQKQNNLLDQIRNLTDFRQE